MRVIQLDSLSRVRVVQHFLEPRTLVGELTAVDTADITVLRGSERLTVPLVYVRHRPGHQAPLQHGGRAAWRRVGAARRATATGLFVLASKAGGSDCADCIFNPSAG